ncbi:hypothetical protein [Luteimicrobium album]|nr:hypothetical protein [Luteimicrobium album]
MTLYDALEVHVELDGTTVLAGRAQSAPIPSTRSWIPGTTCHG